MTSIYFYDLAGLSIAGRASYRSIVLDALHRYCTSSGLKPVAQFAADELGRPYAPDMPGIDMNYSHSVDALAVVLAKGRRNSVGIDIEPEYRTNEIVGVARYAFSLDELECISPDDMLEQWTLKEAALKMYGIGFTEANPTEYTVRRNGDRLYMMMGSLTITQAFYSTFVHSGHRVSVCCLSPLPGNLRLDLVTTPLCPAANNHRQADMP